MSDNLFENILDTNITDNILTSYFDMGIGAYMSNLTVCIAITALLMTLFRRTLSKKFRNSWTYALWIVLPLMFMLPFKIATPFTVIPLMNFNFAVTIDPIEPVFSEGITEISQHNTYVETGGLLFYTLCQWVWMGVFVLLLIIEAVRYKRLERDIKKNGIPCSSESCQSILEKICKELKIKTPQLVIYSVSDTPFAMGIFKPRIILPSENYTDEEIGFILRHEAVHIKRHDIFIKLMLMIFRCANWFNPFAYILCRQAFEDMEITCDEKASESLTEEQRSRYSSAILKGVSRKKYTAVTTYLSTDAKSLKKRISAVMTVKKLGGVIPFILVFAVINLFAATVYAYPDEPRAFYAYIVPYNLEADPYITTEEWKTCTADTIEEAAEKIFCQYMDMYTGEDIPEYYRINSYHITEVAEIETGFFYPQKGILNTNRFAYVYYNAEFANHCGNTVHNKNWGRTLYVNGITEDSSIHFELSRKGDVWTLENYGTATTYGNCHFHSDNVFTGRFNSLDNVQFMAESGLLDYSWNTSDNLPKADNYIMWKYLRWKAYSLDEPVIYPAHDSPFNAPLNTNEFASEIKKSPYIGSNTNTGFEIINADKFDFNDVEAVYCGYDFDPIDGSNRIYFNLEGEKNHGVILSMEHTIGSNGRPVLASMLTSVTVTDELFTPYEFADSFLTADLPAGLTEYVTKENAKAILDYMKSPHDGSDFTVLDYRNITEKEDGIYAEVKFKGRLEGVYSSDILTAMRDYEKHLENELINIDLTATVPEEAYKTGYMTVCILK